MWRCWPTWGIVDRGDADTIAAGLHAIRGEIESGTFAFERSLEDIHMNVEARLAADIGPVAGRLHTARSRNDQVAVDFRLWVRDTVDQLVGQLAGLQKALALRGREHADSVMPGFTHLQSAQPVTLGHHLLAYVEMRPATGAASPTPAKRMNECPLGAAALAGTSFPVDRHATAKALGFDRPTANSLDSVSDRDFALEALAASAICATHLSRFAEEIVLWSTPQFGFASLSDRFSTGSSIMPQKRNPDAAELVRGKSGPRHRRADGASRRDEGPAAGLFERHAGGQGGTFDALATLSLCLAAMTGMVSDLAPDTERMEAAAGSGFSTATDLADYLVRVHGMPFRDAHHVTGRLVALAASRKVGLEGLTLAEMQGEEPRLEMGVFRRPRRAQLGGQSGELRRHRAGQREGAGGAMAEGARRRRLGRRAGRRPPVSYRISLHRRRRLSRGGARQEGAVAPGEVPSRGLFACGLVELFGEGAARRGKGRARSRDRRRRAPAGRRRRCRRPRPRGSRTRLHRAW